MLRAALAMRALARMVVPDYARTLRGDRWRRRVAAATERLVATTDCVLSGPFRGMKYVSAAYSSQLGPKLLGTYELEVADIIEQIIGSGVARVVNVGAAEGYYAVGLLLRGGGLQVDAFESEEPAPEDLLRLAALNGVAGRLRVHGTCTTELLDKAVAGADAVVIMDVDGGEDDLLDPVRAPALAAVPILVELHDHLLPGIERTLRARFSSTHAMRWIPAELRSSGDAPDTPLVPRADMQPLMWEARPDGQSWLWMTPSR